MVLQVDSSLSGVIQGAFVLAFLGVHAWRTQWAQIGEREKNIGLKGIRD
jgi:threonine/homoserine/homoserine lactone efflux protein